MTTIHRGTDGRLLRSQAIRIHPWATVGLGKTLEAGILAYPGKGAWHERLMGLGLMTSCEDAEPVCTIAGLVLFGRAPRRYLRQAGVRWMSFLGDDMSYQAQDDPVIDGSLVALRKGRAGSSRPMVEHGLIERLLDRMRPFIYACFELTGNFLRVTLSVKFWRPEWKASSGCWKYCDR